MQVGTTKDQGLYNKPSAAVHPGALTAGTLPQYNKIQQSVGTVRDDDVRCISLYVQYVVMMMMMMMMK